MTRSPNIFNNGTMRLGYRRGINILELVIAMAVFATIVGGFAVLQNQSRAAKARDAVRKNDLQNIANALDGYYVENELTYPPACGPTPACEDALFESTGPIQPWWIDGLDAEDIPTMPKDPKQAGILNRTAKFLAKDTNQSALFKPIASLFSNLLEYFGINILTDVYAQTVVDVQTQSEFDEASQRDDGGQFQTNQLRHYVISDDKADSRKNGGYRFTNINVPSGATITAANFQVRPDNTENDPDFRIYVEDIDDAPDFVAVADVNSRITSPISESVEWKVDNLVIDAFNPSPDISSLIQKIVNRPGWVSGNDVVILLKANNSVTSKTLRIPGYKEDPVNSPKLHIEYIPPPPVSDNNPIQAEYPNPLAYQSWVASSGWRTGGFEFEANTSGYITHLRCYTDRPVEVKLWDVTTQTLQANETIDCTNNWVSKDIEDVYIVAGNRYIAAATIQAPFDAYRVTVLPGGFTRGGIDVISGAHSSNTGYPGVGFGSIYSLVDITFNISDPPPAGSNIENPLFDKIGDPPYQPGFSSKATRGFRFSPIIDGQITQLWCYTQAEVIVNLWKVGNNTPIASKTINCNEAWVSADLDPDVYINAGTEYIVAAYIDNTEGTYKSGYSAPPIIGQGNINILSGVYNANHFYPGDVGAINGVVDITFAWGEFIPVPYKACGKYGYEVPANRASYVLWACLENEADEHIWNKPTAICKATPPDGSDYNFCQESFGAPEP